MGRVKITLVKRTAKKLYLLYKNDFKDDFASNKPLVQRCLPTANKKLSNGITGYITRIVKQQRDAL